MYLSVLLLDWSGAHAEMRAKALGQCQPEAYTRKKKWGACRAELSKKGGLGKKIQSLIKEDAKKVCFCLDSG